jgi:hypothetical protein
MERAQPDGRINSPVDFQRLRAAWPGLVFDFTPEPSVAADGQPSEDVQALVKCLLLTSGSPTVDIALIEEEAGWPPYLSLEDAQRLDDVREALGRGDLEQAAQLARVFKLTPIAI